MVFSYVLLQSVLWWSFHTAVLFWKVLFPLHARSFEGAHKMKYIHITCVILGFLLPMTTIISSMADFAFKISEKDTGTVSILQNNITFLNGGLGFGVTRFPPILCTATGKDAVFYSLAFPMEIILGVGCTLLVVMIWSINKVSLQTLILLYPSYIPTNELF